MPSARLTRGLGLLGLVAVSLAAAWWWLVYARVMDNDYMTVVDAVPCIWEVTDVCSLAQALCSTDHPLALRRYSSELFWVGIGLISAAMVLPSRRTD